MTEVQSDAERLAELELQLSQLSHLLPEHCAGRDEYIDAHRASIDHWQKIEELEDEIKALKEKLGQG